ncbi:ComF family protein [Ningiella sp. W23]|uniref:ComF family protein n=1 Tax=Ningiella sp. W23 TaxID=3023715 RepID=UPI003757D141
MDIARQAKVAALQTLQVCKSYFGLLSPDAFRFHKHCYICRQSSAAIVCEYCNKDIALPHFTTLGTDLLNTPTIRKHLVLPYYHELHAIGEYKGVLKQLINKLKFSNQMLACQVLHHFFEIYVLQRLRQVSELPDALVPIPLSKWRYAKRGYNQARELAKAISSETDIPILDALVKHTHTRAQSELSREQRLQNVEGVFSLAQVINCSHIALVDDVMTTGATINSACETIVKQYPEMKISVWVMALTPSPQSKKP